MAIKIKKKKTEVEEVDPILEQDQFLQTSDKSISWAAENRQKVLIALVSLAAIALVAVFLAKYSEKSEVERLFAGNEKVKKLCGWEPEFGGIDGFKRGLKLTAEWFGDPENLRMYKSTIYNI